MTTMPNKIGARLSQGDVNLRINNDMIDFELEIDHETKITVHMPPDKATRFANRMLELISQIKHKPIIFH